MSFLHAWLVQDTVFQSSLASSVHRELLPSTSFLVTVSSLDEFKVLALEHFYSSQICSVGVSLISGKFY